MRITSRRNFLFAAIGFFVSILFIFQYLDDERGDKSIGIFIAVELLLIAYSLLWLNCVDIYQEADDNLRCYFFGKRFEVPSDRRIGRLLFGMFFTGWRRKFYRIGYISFRNDAGKRSLKFFILADRDWHLIEERGLS